MSETLYAILTNGSILPISDVTALALDNTLTIKPGDTYRNEYLEQTMSADAPVLLTNTLGDQVTPTAPHTESWLCSFWKFTRGASLPILRLAWSDVEAICDQYPNRAYSGNNTGVLYLPLRSGNVAVITGVAASTSAVTVNTSMTVYPGDYYRNVYLEQAMTPVGTFNGLDYRLLATNQKGDAKDGDALNPESWDASHYEFTRTGLITLYTPWRHVEGGPATSYLNRAA